MQFKCIAFHCMTDRMLGWLNECVYSRWLSEWPVCACCLPAARVTSESIKNNRPPINPEQFQLQSQIVLGLTGVECKSHSFFARCAELQSRLLLCEGPRPPRWYWFAVIIVSFCGMRALYEQHHELVRPKADSRKLLAIAARVKISNTECLTPADYPWAGVAATKFEFTRFTRNAKLKLLFVEPRHMASIA